MTTTELSPFDTGLNDRRRAATERQISFVLSLCADLAAHPGWEADAHSTARVYRRESEILGHAVVPTRAEASRAIEWLKSRLALARAATPEPRPAAVEVGYYEINDGGEHDGIYKVRPARSGDHNYAMILDPEIARFSYAPGAMRRIKPEHRIDRERAAELGRTHGFCIACGALLTDPESIERGIGPICATKF